MRNRPEVAFHQAQSPTAPLPQPTTPAQGPDPSKKNRPDLSPAVPGLEGLLEIRTPQPQPQTALLVPAISNCTYTSRVGTVQYTSAMNSYRQYQYHQRINSDPARITDWHTRHRTLSLTARMHANIHLPESESRPDSAGRDTGFPEPLSPGTTSPDVQSTIPKALCEEIPGEKVTNYEKF